MGIQGLSSLLLVVGMAGLGCGSGSADIDGGAVDDGGSGVGDAGTDASSGACGQILTFADGIAPSTELHVATSGSDSSGTGTAEAPFATIEHAAQQAGPGTAIVVHAGTYAGGLYLAQLRGTAEAPIWIGGASGESKPLLEGGGNGMQLSRAAYLVVHDLEIAGATDNGINADDGALYADETAAHHLVFTDLDIHDIGGGGNQDCLKLSGINDFVVKDSQFARCGGGQSGSGIDHVGCHRGAIARNLFEAMSGNAVQAKGGSTDLQMWANTVDDGGERAFNMGGSTGFEFFRPPLSTTAPNAEARNIAVVANVIRGSTAAIGFVGCVDCRAWNNTIIDPERWVFRILQETTTGGGYTFEPAQDSDVTNNLVYFSSAQLSTHVNVGAGTEPATFSFRNNLWFAHDAPANSTPTLPVTETGSVIGMDPGLAASGEIASSSPAAGAGLDVDAVQGDMRGTCYRNPPSIGAWELPPGQ